MQFFKNVHSEKFGHFLNDVESHWWKKTNAYLIIIPKEIPTAWVCLFVCLFVCFGGFHLNKEFFTHMETLPWRAENYEIKILYVGAEVYITEQEVKKSFHALEKLRKIVQPFMIVFKVIKMTTTCLIHIL